MTEEERFAVADHAVAQLKGRLNDGAKPAPPPFRLERSVSESIITI